MVLVLPRKINQTLDYTNSQKQKLKPNSVEDLIRDTAKGNAVLHNITKRSDFSEKLVSVFNVVLT